MAVGKAERPRRCTRQSNTETHRTRIGGIVMSEHWKIFLALLGFLSVGSCGTAPSVDAWFVDSLVKVFQDEKFSAHPVADTDILVPRNGHGSLQLCIRPTSQLENFQASLEWSEGTPGGIMLQLRRVGY